MKAAFAELGLPEPANEGIHIGPPIGNTIRELLGDQADRLFDQTLLTFRKHYRERGLFEADLYPGIPELLEKLRSHGVPLYVATAKLEPFAQQLLEHQKVAHYFQRIYGSRANGELSLKSDLVSFLRQSEASISDHSYMIGDRHHDIDGANLNRLLGVGVTWGYGSADELQAARASLIVSSPTELHAYIG